jgi:hypothetical protein
MNEINRARRLHIDYSRWCTRRKRDANEMTLEKNRNARRATEKRQKINGNGLAKRATQKRGERAELCI